MNTDQVKGKLKEAAGEAQEQVGKATGNTDQEVRGHAHEQEGKVQKKVGDLKDGVDKIVRKP
ncbi:MAG TPA: CsbD family protein [Ramlibacter sp.]|uniref:CsbD family protein n=1 Tax=Ramlibacter sp. TaxID=1917967 RepID=UPI002D74520E|nr:CsbD family protein [Ramlibacter sp.]HZY18383.1 CsbD family protein [Ramlibacter sp.]